MSIDLLTPGMGRHASGVYHTYVQYKMFTSTTPVSTRVFIECQYGVIFLCNKVSVSTDLWFCTPHNLAIVAVVNG